jgi:hypothetical protein
MKKGKEKVHLWNIILVACGTVFTFLAIFYWIVPAYMLPSFMPGYDPTLDAIHFKHGLASLIIALGFFVYLWFRNGKKKKA